MLDVDDVVTRVPGLVDQIRPLQETLIANLIMLAEIPAPTFGEEDRIHFLKQRFCECGLQNISTDEAGNGLGIIPGRDDKKNILVVAHADTLCPKSQDHTVTVQPDRLVGSGIADNSLGLATLVTLPSVLEKLGIEFESNIVLLGAVRGLGRGNMEGLSFFMDNTKRDFRGAVCVEGAQLGRLSYSSSAMLRGEIRCTVPEEYDWIKRGQTGAILTLNEVINRLLAIRVPRKPQTSITLGSVSSGASYNLLPTEGSIRFEVRSECDEMVQDIEQQIEDIVAEVKSLTASDLVFDVVARREAGGIEVGHPLVRASRHILDAVGVTPRIFPSISELAVLILHKLPAVTIGLTKAENLQTPQESVEIDPMFTGLAQLIGLLIAIDGGVCDEPEEVD
ncbi:peptidase dimerization domain-containing protein [Verrucomicrobiota bacterium]